MNLKQSRRKDGRVYLSIEKAYRDKASGKPRATTVRSLGYLDILEKEYPDPVAFFREEARRMTEEDKRKQKAAFEVDLNEALPPRTEEPRNLGYGAILKIAGELGLEEYLVNRHRPENLRYNIGAVARLLVISAILSPGSLRASFEQKDRYFERFDFSLSDVYDACSRLAELAQELPAFLRAEMSGPQGVSEETVYYYMADFPGSQMGLAADAEGLPLHFDVFPGGRANRETLGAAVAELRKKYGSRRVLAVANMGGALSETILGLQAKEREASFNGYLIRTAFRSESEDSKRFTLSPDNYLDLNGLPARKDADFKVKSRRVSRDISTQLPGGNRVTKTVTEKQVVCWARWDKNSLCMPDCALAVEEQRFEGYSAMATSELDLPDPEVIRIGRCLREMEELCRPYKEDQDPQPAAQARLLTGYIALLILRIMEKRAGGRFLRAGGQFRMDEIRDCLRQISCVNESENVYLFHYRSPVSDALGQALGLDFTRKRLRLADIKDLLAQAKK